MISSFEKELSEHGYLVYTNVGTSMLPLIHQNKDVLTIVKPNRPLKRYDIVLYKSRGGSYILHRILKVRENDYVICGDNCWTKEYGITDENILGILISITRDDKTLDIDSKKQKFYAHLWCDFFPVRYFLLRSRHYLWKIKRRIIKK